MEIRPATVDDLPDLYEVCLRTGDAGEDASASYADPDLLGSVYVGPYVVLDDTVAFAGVDGAGVAGYVLAAIDTPSFEIACERVWWPPLRERYPMPETPTGRADDRVIGYIHRPPTMAAAVVERYPAHLHIDLLPRVQGRGNGRRMIDTLVAALQAVDVPGVHLGVAAANTRAIGFYEHLGFRTLHAGDDGRLMGLRW